MFYEKFQFFKRRKKRLVYDKMKHLRSWRHSVRSNHKKGLWRFNNYKRERLTRKLAFFFYTIRSNFSDFWGETSLYINRNFNLAYNALAINFNGLLYSHQPSVLVYELAATFPHFFSLFILGDWALHLVLHQILQIFSFFLHTNIGAYYILPAELIGKLASDLFIGFNQSLWGRGLLNSQSVYFLYVLPVCEFDLQQKNLFIGPSFKYLVDNNHCLFCSSLEGGVMARS